MLAVSGAGCLAGAVLLSRHRDDPGGAWTLAGCGVALLLMAALGAPLRFELLEALRLEQAQLSP